MKYLGIELQMQNDGWQIFSETDMPYNTYTCCSHTYKKENNIVSIYLPCPRWQLFIESSKRRRSQVHELPNSLEELNKLIENDKKMDSPRPK